MSINQTVLAVLVYQARFHKLAQAKVLLAVAVSMSQLAVCLIVPKEASLVYAHLLAAVLVTGFLLYRLLQSSIQGFGWPKWGVAKKLLKQNYRFPVFAMPSDFISTFSAQLPLFLIMARFGGAAAAVYALTIRVLAGPIGLLANSILAVFKEQAGRDFREVGDCLHSYRRTFFSLVVIALPPFATLYFVAEEAFVVIFGAEWAEAGRIAETLSPMFFLKFVASPLSYTMYLADRQLHDLVWQLVLFGMTFVVFKFSSNLESAVLTYCFGYSGLYLVYLGMSYTAARGVKA
jgi:O-antigen/teichoic acid export membrane protein